MSAVASIHRTGHRSRWIVAAILIAAFMLDLLNVTIVNVGLPAIQRDLAASVAELGWISAIYQLAFAVALITAARLGDVWGRRRIFLIGIAAFVGASLWCGLAGSATQLIAARAAQGLSAALIVPQVMSILYGLFEGEERATVFGLFGLAAGIAQACGLLLGGILVTADLAGLGWRPIFLASVPVALLLIAFAIRYVPESRAEGALRPRWLSALILTAALVAVVFPLLEGQQNGWPLWGWALLACGILAVIGLALGEHKIRSWRDGALLPLEFFASRTVIAGLAILVPVSAGFSGFLLVLALWLQEGLGFSALQAGTVTIAFSAGGLAMAMFVGRLAMRFGRMLVLAGCVVAACAGIAVLGAGLFLVDVFGLWALVPGLFLCGVGINMVMPSLTSLFLAAVPPASAGSASGIWNTAQQFGGAMGVAILSTIFFSVLAARNYQTGFAISVIVASGALALGGVLCLLLPAHVTRDGQLDQAHDKAPEGLVFMRKTIIIAGGTDGIGRALANMLLQRGERVTILGTSQTKGEAFVASAKGGAGQAAFIRADLNTIAGNHVAISAIRAKHESIDALVLCARFLRMQRHVTADGLEDNFALNYLSRYMFSYGLEKELRRSGQPVIINVSGPGGALSLIDWDDLQLARSYDGLAAMFQAGKLNDLLGIAFAARADPKPRYVLFHPDTTATSFAGELDDEMLAHVEALRRTAKPASAAAGPIMTLIDQTPGKALSAFRLEREMDLHLTSLDHDAARRLDQLTRQILS